MCFIEAFVAHLASCAETADSKRVMVMLGWNDQKSEKCEKRVIFWSKSRVAPYSLRQHIR